MKNYDLEAFITAGMNEAEILALYKKGVVSLDALGNPIDGKETGAEDEAADAEGEVGDKTRGVAQREQS
jgi:hypothetical protein